jgi:hypothetical protein
MAQREFLFVGGACDGERRELSAYDLSRGVVEVPVLTEPRSVQRLWNPAPVMTGYKIERYTLRTFHLRAGLRIQFLAEADLSDEHAFLLLFERYPQREDPDEHLS